MPLYLESCPSPAFERLSVSVRPTVGLANFVIKAHPTYNKIDALNLKPKHILRIIIITKAHIKDNNYYLFYVFRESAKLYGFLTTYNTKIWIEEERHYNYYHLIHVR